MLSFLLGASTALAQSCPPVGRLKDFNCDGKHRVVFTGDSIVRGVGDPELADNLGGYQRFVSQDLSRSEVENMGVPGIDSRRLLRDFMRNLSKGKVKTTEKARDADLFFIEVGTNDFFTDHDPLGVTRNIKRLIRFLSQFYRDELGTVPPVFVVTTLPPTRREFQQPFIDTVNEELLLRTSRSLPVQIRFDRLPNTIISDDLLHPDEEGYREMADLILAFLEDRAKVKGHKKNTH